MAKTVAERQAAYRAKRPFSGKNGNGERRLNTWVDTGSYFALERLANRYGVTKRQMVEKLVAAADDKILAGINPDSPEWMAYLMRD